MLFEQPDTLSNAEKEILLLKAAYEGINSIANWMVFDITGEDPDSEIRFESEIHQRYFIILLIDFLSLRTFEDRKKDFLKQLLKICEEPVFNPRTANLKKSISNFFEWLYADVEFEHNGEVRKLWFPSINVEIALKIKRILFIEICGNITKHNPLGLSVQAKSIRKVFSGNGKEISITDSRRIMNEFYEQFHVDLFTYHASTIAEFLNNIRCSIYEYLQPLYVQCREYYWNEEFQEKSYRYIYPDSINNDYVKELFWDLMNDVRSPPYIRRFQVTRYLKMRY